MAWKFFAHEPVEDNEWLAPAEPDFCPYEYVPDFVAANGFLPAECLTCYKPLIFWRYDGTIPARFKQLLSSLSVGVTGKYNDELVVFYTDSQRKVRELEAILVAKLGEFSINGRFQWRVSGKYWQRRWPEFFTSAKELSPKAFPKTVPWLSVAEWLERDGG